MNHEFGNIQYCFNGIVTTDVEKICALLPKSITVTDANGNIPHGFFVRRFNDNTCIVLNLYGKSQICKVNGKDVEFDEHGLFISTMPQKSVLHSKKEKIFPTFHVNYCNDNMIRAMYINSQTISKIDADSEYEVCFAVRKDSSAWTFHYGVAGNYSGAAIGTIGIAREGTFLVIEDKKRDRG